jgi:hypothetical protein
MMGSISLLLISAALKMFVNYPPVDTGAGTMMLSVFLPFWFSVLGIVGVSVAALWWLVGRLGRQPQKATCVPSRSPKEMADENKWNSFTRVA